MKYTIYILISVMGLFLLSCDKKTDDDTGDLNFRFKLMYGDKPMEMFKTYDYPVTNDKFQMTRLSFYISDLTIKTQNDATMIKDIDYLNVTNSHTAPVAANGFEYKFLGIKVGNYQTVDFGIGVPKEMNAQAPKDFDSNHILSSSAEYWTSWKSYVFFKPEGIIGLNGNPTPETPFALHLGGDDALRKITLAKPFIVSKDQVTNVDIILDMQKFFNGKSLYELSKTQQIHSVSQLTLINQLADNMQISFR
ncbi:MAG: hypothetical protein IPL55_01195 [Saprospiraceae bacterium]|nr:hypothetical protein [Saprospiraceae bacterium]